MLQGTKRVPRSLFESRLLRFVIRTIVNLEIIPWNPYQPLILLFVRVEIMEFAVIAHVLIPIYSG